MTNAGVNGWPSAAGDPRYLARGASYPAGYLRSGSYYWTSSQATSSTSVTLGNGTLRLAPWLVPNACTIARIGASVTLAGDSGSTLRLGIYADDGTGYPGALVLDAGTIAADSATVQEITVTRALTAGLYWVGGVVQGVTVTQPTVTIVSGSSGAYVSLGTSAPLATQSALGVGQGSVTGALPGALSQTVSAVGSAPRVFVKVA